MAQQHTRTLPNSEEAELFAARVIRQKLRKGYVETNYVRLERISNKARLLAKKLRFVGTEGGPLLILPQELLSSWNGVFDADGKYIFETEPCDYSRACEWKGKWVNSIRVGEGTGLVLQSISAAAWLADEHGGIILRWSAADSAAPLVHSALTVSQRTWKSTRLRIKVGSSQSLILLDATRKGSDLLNLPNNEFMERGFRWALRIQIPEGTYAVDQIDSIQGRLLDRELPTDFCMELTRLRILG